MDITSTIYIVLLAIIGCDLLRGLYNLCGLVQLVDMGIMHAVVGANTIPHLVLTSRILDYSFLAKVNSSVFTNWTLLQIKKVVYVETCILPM